MPLTEEGIAQIYQLIVYLSKSELQHRNIVLVRAETLDKISEPGV